MRVRFVSPYQLEADVIDFNLRVKRGEEIEVSDAVGAVLIQNPLFVRVWPPRPPKPAPAPPPPPPEPDPQPTASAPEAAAEPPTPAAPAAKE